MQNKKTQILVTSALMIALAFVLSLITVFRMPQGGSITLFSMLPIAICGYLFGWKNGITAGIALGLLNLIINPYIVHPAQVFLDYPLAFGALGMGAFLRNSKLGLVTCYLIGVFCRFLCSFASGVIFFGSFAPEGFNAILWSFYYNITYMGVEALATIVILLIPAVKSFFISQKFKYEDKSNFIV